MSDAYKKAVSFLESLPLKEKWSLRPTRDLCRALGVGPKALTCVIVTGTNGKGSVCALMESAIRHAGYRTGLYVSPHLVDYTERIQVSGREISKEDFARLILQAKPVAESYNSSHKEKLSQFEVLTACAFRHFADEKIDFAVLEVGMGGRLDATNVAEPLVSVITRVGLDHVPELGKNERDIAREKAGIMRKSTATVTGCTGKSLDALKERAGEVGSRLVVVGKKNCDSRFAEKAVTLQKTSVRVENSGGGGTAELSTKLLGVHQRGNMALAYAALSEIAATKSLSISGEDIRAGFLDAKWPGRLEKVSEKPLVIFDGAHNPDAAKALAASVRQLLGGKKIFLVCAMMKDKDIGGFLSIIAPLATKLFATTLPMERAASAGRIAESARKYCKVVVIGNCHYALAKAMKEAGKGAGAVLVCGSLYLVGELKRTGFDKAHKNSA